MIRLHLGCGKVDFGEKWDHIDSATFPHIKSHDITMLPYDDNSVGIIHASHVLEYFDQYEANAVLYEWKRVLCGGGLGVIRIAVPDLYAISKLIVAGVGVQNFVGPIYGRMTDDGAFGDLIYHKFGYTFDSLKSKLEYCGFCNISRYDWRDTDEGLIDDCSQAYFPHMNKLSGMLISLNVRASRL